MPVSRRGGASAGDEERLVVLIISRLQPVIIATIREVVTAENVTFSQIFATSESFEAFVAKIIARLRPIIIEAVRVALPKPTTTTQRPAPQPSNLKNIFGESGANFVKVDTKNYNYGYMTDK